ncbi:MAG: hypothetical protein ACPG1A_16695, partial [Halioglobus sp.]
NNWDGFGDTTFGDGDRTRFGRLTLSGVPVFAVGAFVSHAAESGNWTGIGSSLFSERQTLWATADTWSSGVTWSVLSDAKPAQSGVWSAAATVSPGGWVQNLHQAADSDNWSGGASTLTPDGTRTAGAVMNALVGTPRMIAEPRFQADGDTHWQHDGTLTLDSALDATIDYERVLLYPAKPDWEGIASGFAPDAQRIQRVVANAPWTATGTLEAAGGNYHTATMDLGTPQGDLAADAKYVGEVFDFYMSGKATWVKPPSNFTRGGVCTFSPELEVDADPTMYYGGTVMFQVAPTVQFKGENTQYAETVVSYGTSFAANARKTAYSLGDWDGTLEGTIYGGLLSLAPAGPSRTFEVPKLDRVFRVAGTTERVFKVAA